MRKAEKATNKYIIHAISDTHNKHEKLTLTGGDILIHSGDATSRGTLEECLAFLYWFGQQPYTYKIFVPGNHDIAFEKYAPLLKDAAKTNNIHLLMDSGIVLDNINIWGSPVQPEFHNWAFNRRRGDEIQRHWDLIPKNTEILITHGPPSTILDAIRIDPVPLGCQNLYLTIFKKLKKLRLHIFGHIHDGSGYKRIGDKLFINASVLDEGYNLLNKPKVINRTLRKIYKFEFEPKQKRSKRRRKIKRLNKNIKPLVSV